MRKFLLLLAGIAPAFLYAQNIQEEAFYIHTISQASKRQIVKEYVGIEDHEAAAFWQIYDSYEFEHRVLEKERIALLKEYVDNYTLLTDRSANKLMGKLMVNNINCAKLSKRYYHKFQRAITPLKAARFFQLEGYIQNSLQSYLQDRFFVNQLESARR